MGEFRHHLKWSLQVDRERGMGRLVDDEEGKERSSARRYAFLFKRSSSAGVKALLKNDYNGREVQ